MGTLIFLRDLCGYVWVNIFTLSSSRVRAERIGRDIMRDNALAMEEP